MWAARDAVRGDQTTRGGDQGPCVIKGRVSISLWRSYGVMKGTIS